MIHQIPEDERPLRLPQSTESAGAPDDEESGGNLWATLNDRLSGRWPHAITAGLVLGLVAAIAGYKATSVSYEAVGMIQVSPRITPLMRDTPETALMPLYQNYVETQARMVREPRVLEQAIRRMDLDETPWESPFHARRALESRLGVRTERNTELILVSFRAESSSLAQYVTNAVLHAYDEIHGSVAGDQLGQTMNDLRVQRNQLREEANQKNQEVERIVDQSGYPVSDFEDFIRRRTLAIDADKDNIRSLKDRLALEEARAASSSAAEDPELLVSGEEQDPRINHRELEAFDRKLADLGQRLHQARLDWERAQTEWTPAHHGYELAERRYRQLERMYEERAALVAEDFVAAGHTLMANTPADIRARIEQLERHVKEQQEEAQQMLRWQRRINELRTGLEEIDLRRADVDNRIHELEVEADRIRAGRIQIAALAERPLRPSQDRRRALAMIGAVGGFGAGIGAFFLLGTVDRRVYLARQLASGRPGMQSRLLGVLPALPQRAGDVESSSVAAHCVHQIRNHVEATRAKDGPVVLAISSPYQGDGKTSLVMSLGASYAAAGSRVLLVDCDLVGKNLTTHSMMSGQAGLREALRSGDANGYAVPLPIENASVLPVGNDPSFGPEMIRREGLVRVFDQLRAEYDVILVDTGPLFGGIESLPVSAAADGVILTMQRGRRHARLEECIDELRSVGASYLGLVLNHARISDCDRYVSKSRISAVVTAHEAGIVSNGNGRAKPPAPRASRNVLLRAMQVTSRIDT